MEPRATVPWPFESDTRHEPAGEAPLARIAERLRAYRRWVDTQAGWAREAQQLHATARMLAEGKAGRPRAAEATRDLAALRDSQIDPTVHRLLNAWPALAPEGLPPLEDHGDQVHWWLLENRPGHAPHTNGAGTAGASPADPPPHLTVPIAADRPVAEALADGLATALGWIEALHARDPAAVDLVAPCIALDLAQVPASGVAARVIRRVWSLTLGIRYTAADAARGLACLNAAALPTLVDHATQLQTDRLEDAVLDRLMAHGHFPDRARLPHGTFDALMDRLALGMGLRDALQAGRAGT